MLQEMQPEVAVILTPPFLHASLTIACLQAGCHVLVEKPMALSVEEADKMIATAQAQRRLLGVVFQQRFRAEVLAAKRLLEEGCLGQLQHIDLVAACPRPVAYYQERGWRGTWAGEGGGVVMNQAPMPLICFVISSECQDDLLPGHKGNCIPLKRKIRFKPCLNGPMEPLVHWLPAPPGRAGKWRSRPQSNASFISSGRPAPYAWRTET